MINEAVVNLKVKQTGSTIYLNQNIMKRIDLFHPRVFSDPEWAEGYYNRNKINITRVAFRLVDILRRSGFKGGKILDAGCGFGVIPIELAKRFPDSEIVAVDLGEPLLEKAGSLARAAGVGDKIIFRKGDVQKMDYEDHSFDLVINTFMLHVVEDPVAMLNEIERLANENGIILISDLRRIWLGHIMKKLKSSFTLEEGLNIINRSNLRQGQPARGPFWWDYFTGLN
jgi:2-polyprenyl-3-methyl-5-hydroxy-6-metoxy-1,4-benzoquinol methylase